MSSSLLCPKCKYPTKFQKYTTEDNSVKNKEIDYTILLAQILSNDNINEIINGINIGDILKSDDFKSLSKDKRTKINLKLYEISNKSNMYYNVCINPNCSYYSTIDNNAHIYSKNVTLSKDNLNEILFDPKTYINNNILPRTKKYNCQNSKCKSHLKENYNIKEAVFDRISNTNLTILYVCTVCEASWQQ
jgi:hypothetical protein